MKIKDLIYNVKKSDLNKDWVDPEVFQHDLRFDNPSFNYEKVAERMTCYFAGSWYCTDSAVGTRVYFLDDQPVALSFQSGRKSDENIYFTSKETAVKVREFLLSCIENADEDPYEYCGYLNLDDDIGDGYHINYTKQITNISLASGILFGDKEVKYVGDGDPKDYISQKCVIKTEGREKTVDIDKLKFKWLVE